MTLHTSCPSCGRTASIAEDAAGRSAICPACFSRFLIAIEPEVELGTDRDPNPIATATTTTTRRPIGPLPDPSPPHPSQIRRGDAGGVFEIEAPSLFA